MAEEVEQIMHHIHERHNFLLSGGAGSGKTYTLVQVIKQIIKEYPSSMIACITYTNAGVREIERRVDHKNLRVSTIHDFLWDCIGSFQKELRKSLVYLMNSERIRSGSNITLPVPDDFFTKDGEILKIQYKEYLRLSEGIISHDEVIAVADYMFNHYQKLREIVKGSYPFILIDEYQDTNPTVVKNLLTEYEGDRRKSIIGFFGDSMQAIYDDGVGDLNAYLAPNGNVYEVLKEQNRRSPLSVINLANKIRLDNLQQRPSEDNEAPNMVEGHVKQGKALFLYSNNERTTVETVRNYLRLHEHWDFEDSSATKELNLTHNLIAYKAGFGTLMEIHRGDGIYKYKDRVKKFVTEVAFDTEEKTFGQVLADLRKTYPRDVSKYEPSRGSQNNFIREHPDWYNNVLSLPYDIVASMFVSPDQLVDDKKQEEDEGSKTGSKRSALVRHLMNIERCIYMYHNNHVAEFLRTTEYEINSIADKIALRESIDQLVNVDDHSIGEIIDKADELGIVLKDDTLNNYKQKTPYIYDRVMEVPYREVQNLYKYLEGMTPFSTQHKTKGAELDNVFVILDNGHWNNYNFEKLFTANEDELNTTVVKRTRKIFYVCCTRTKENLAVYYHTPKPNVLAKATEWFGEDNVVDLDEA